jgi:pyridinium-3,5-biscarboxylic acid mononucleotide sulfurtransferase
MEKSVERKLEELRRHIRRLDSALASCAGTVDNSFLMRICREELGEKALAVRMLADSYPKGEISMAGRVAKVMGAKRQPRPSDSLQTSRKSSPAIRNSHLYSSLKSLAMRTILRRALRDAGQSSEDSRRMIAVRQAGIHSPILETNVSKAEIRVLAKELGLPNWDKAKSARTVGQIRAHRKAAVVKRYLESIGFHYAEVSIIGGKAYIAVAKTQKFICCLPQIKKRMRSLGVSGVLLLLS